MADDMYDADQILSLVSSEMSNRSRNSTPADISPPHLDFLFRMYVIMSDQPQNVGAVSSSPHSRLIMPIMGGRVNGPHFRGEVVPNSGADWASPVKGTSFASIDARYTLRSHDGHLVYVQSQGIFSPSKPPPQANVKSVKPTDIEPADADWFTRLRFETGEGPYSWMNKIFALGVLTMKDKKVVVDVYHVTHSPGKTIDGVKAKLS